MVQLVLRYSYSDQFDPGRDDAEEAGRLTVLVTTEQFSGTGTFDTAPEDVRKFGESLSTFPIASDKPLRAQWGYGGHGSSVMVSAANATGALLVTVEIEESLFALAGERVPEGVRTAFVTDYPAVDAFRRSVANLMDRKVDEAVLRGH